MGFEKQSLFLTPKCPRLYRSVSPPYITGSELGNGAVKLNLPVKLKEGHLFLKSHSWKVQRKQRNHLSKEASTPACDLISPVYLTVYNQEPQKNPTH